MSDNDEVPSTVHALTLKIFSENWRCSELKLTEFLSWRPQKCYQRWLYLNKINAEPPSVTHYSPTCPLTSVWSRLWPALPNWSLRIWLKDRGKKRTRIVEIRVDGHAVVQPRVYDPRPQLVAGLGRVALVVLTWVAAAATASAGRPAVGMRKAVADAGLGLAVSQVVGFVSGAQLDPFVPKGFLRC